MPQSPYINLDLADMSEADRVAILIAAFKWTEKQKGRLPLEAYWARLQAFPVVYMEVVTFVAVSETKDLVLLDMRPETDPHYANQYGTQGATLMMRQTLDETWAKHVADESHIPLMEGEVPTFCGVVFTPRTPRDHAVTVVFRRTFYKVPPDYQGTFVDMDDIDNLPVAKSCRKYIDVAYQAYLHGSSAYRVLEQLEDGN